MTSELFPPANPRFGKGATYHDTGPQLPAEQKPPRIHRLHEVSDSSLPAPRIHRSASMLALEQAGIHEPKPVLESNTDQAELQKRQYLEELFTLPTVAELMADKNPISDMDPTKRVQTTEQSERDALDTYSHAESRIRSMIESFRTTDGWNQEDTPAMIRVSKELRIQLGSYFLGKLSVMQGLPERVTRNDMKRPNMPGYGYQTRTSQEVAALYALAMLDGTFKNDMLDQDLPDKYTTTNSLGQHTTAARQVIMQYT